MKTVNIHQAKTHLSRLVDLALAGEEVIIARRKQPLVRLTVVKQEYGERQVGLLPDLVQSLPDNFNDSMDDWTEGLIPDVESPSHMSKP